MIVTKFYLSFFLQDGSTVLHVAIHDGNYEAVELLLKHQADAGTQDSQGRAPMHWATMLPDTQCLEVSQVMEGGIGHGRGTLDSHQSPYTLSNHALNTLCLEVST